MIELHDDDSTDSMLLIRHIEYGRDAIVELASQVSTQRIAISIGICNIAGKSDVPNTYDSIT